MSDVARIIIPKGMTKEELKDEEEEEEREEFYDEHGYYPNFEEQVIYMLKGGNVSEEGLQDLWAWYCRELWRPTEPGGEH